MKTLAGSPCRPGLQILALALIVVQLVAQPPSAPPGGPQEDRGDTRVTLKVKDQPLVDVINHIRERAGVNIMLAEGVDEKVTVDLTQVPWRVALEIVAERAGCILVEKAPNVIRIESPPRVTFNFTGADVKTVIDAIAKVSGASIVTAPTVEGSVHLRINDVPWRTALDTVVKSLGYVVVEDGWNIYRVVSPSSLETQMVTKVFRVKYLRPPPRYAPNIKTEYATDKAPKQAAGGAQQDPSKTFTLIQALRSALSPTGKLDFYETTNLLVVRDIPPVVAEVERMLAEIDVEPAQVFIDVKFVTTTNTDALSYGVDIGQDGLTVGLTGGSIPSRLPFEIGTGGWNNEIIASAGANTPGLAGQELADAITFGRLDFTRTTFTLNLLAQDESSRIVQAPKLLALDNQEATIFVGRTIRFAETTAESNQSGGLTYSIKEAANSPVQTGFQLYLVPHIIPGSDKIMMTVIPEAEQLVGRSEDPNLQGFQIFTSGEGTENEVSIALPQIASSTLVTTLLLESGETAVIGGLITESDVETVRKLPVLGDIPVLGFFFKTESRSKVNESLLIFITPRIIRDSDVWARFIQEEEQRRQGAIESEVERIFAEPGAAEHR